MKKKRGLLEGLVIGAMSEGVRRCARRVEVWITCLETRRPSSVPHHGPSPPLPSAAATPSGPTVPSRSVPRYIDARQFHARNRLVDVASSEQSVAMHRLFGRKRVSFGVRSTNTRTRDYPVVVVAGCY